MAKAPKKRSGGGSSRRIGLAAFFRKLWSKPDLLDEFSSGRKGREAVLAQFNLAPAHATMLKDLCLRDIIRELAGVKTTGAWTTVIGGAAQVRCGHPECRAFQRALKRR